MDVGFQPEGEAAHVKEAKEALVFLLVPVTGRTRYPAAYFYIDSIDSQLQYTLIKQFLDLTAEKSIVIVNITCDGCKANLTTLKKLGASIPDRPSFPHPTQNYQVNVTLDPVHMLKLCRNAFGTLRIFHSNSGEINYKYIEDLVALQEESGL